MHPGAAVAEHMLKVTGFIAREPADGAQPTQDTDVYLAYDDHNLYAVFICWDKEPDKIRARMTRREDIFSDDSAEIMIDTFNDARRGYAFAANPLGIQWDALWTEGPSARDSPLDYSGFDQSFDTVWNSEGRLTGQGYMLLMTIPFKSLRFPNTDPQQWRIILNRSIPRTNENLFWPRISNRIQGRFNQAAIATGLEMSRVRNIQLIPYGLLRGFRDIDQRDPANPFFESRTLQPEVGLDAKFILHDSFVLDATVNPDFSQVESDQPQITVNQRFEVFFPEKRPFFLENSNYFTTPIDLVFTRRIAHPEFGLRLTGKSGTVGRRSAGQRRSCPGRGAAANRSARGRPRDLHHRARQPRYSRSIERRRNLHRPRIRRRIQPRRRGRRKSEARRKIGACKAKR